MDWWIIAFPVVIGFLALWFVGERQGRAATAAAQEHIRHIEEEGRARADEFERSLEREWGPRDHRGDAYFREYVMMSADQRRVRFVGIKVHPYLEIRWDEIVLVETIVAVELQQASETIMRFETTSITKQGSPLLRAAVGGLAFGGAGAIVGAVTAPKMSTANTIGRNETRQGPTYIVIGTTDIQSPMVKRILPSRQIAESWLHRIRGAIALRQRHEDNKAN